MLQSCTSSGLPGKSWGLKGSNTCRRPLQLLKNLSKIKAELQILCSDRGEGDDGVSSYLQSAITRGTHSHPLDLGLKPRPLCRLHVHEAENWETRITLSLLSSNFGHLGDLWRTGDKANPERNPQKQPQKAETRPYPRELRRNTSLITINQPKMNLSQKRLS